MHDGCSCEKVERNRLLFGSVMLGILIDIRDVGINRRDRLNLFVLFVATLLKVR